MALPPPISASPLAAHLNKSALERVPFGWNRHCEEPHNAAYAPRYSDEAIQATAGTPFALLWTGSSFLCQIVGARDGGFGRVAPTLGIDGQQDVYPPSPRGAIRTAQ
jgi:hypothetical protein